MRLRLPLALVLALATSRGLLTAKDTTQPKAEVMLSKGNYQDLVYLGAKRPVLFRLFMEKDGQPYRVAWRNYIAELFKFLDRNNDGVLSKEEALRAPSPQQLLLFFGGSFFANNNQRANVRDINAEDGKITVDDLANYYELNGAGPLQLTLNQNTANTTSALTDALFLHLDTNKDGRLSKDELLRAPALLEQLDVNDDELISSQELTQNLYGYAVADRRMSRPKKNRLLAPTEKPLDGTFLLLQMDASHRQQTTRLKLAQQMLARYDKNENRKLSRSEIGLDKASFDLLDRNKDGQLDIAELMKFTLRPADINLVVRLGKTSGIKPSLDLARLDNKPAPLDSSVDRTSTRLMHISLVDSRLDVRTIPASAIYAAVRGVRQFYLTQFKEADTNKDGYLDLREIQKSRNNLYLRPVWQIADRDGDGKLSKAELEAYLNLLEKAPGCSAQLTINNLGRGLFGLLDANGDGHLGLRELRTASIRLAKYDNRKHGYVKREDVPQQFQIAIGVAAFNNPFGQMGGGFGTPVATSNRPNPGGPLWFRQMDRNGDGDVSPSEFLGTRQDFKLIDTDGDGLIDADEANRADAWFRKKLVRK